MFPQAKKNFFMIFFLDFRRHPHWAWTNCETLNLTCTAFFLAQKGKINDSAVDIISDIY